MNMLKTRVQFAYDTEANWNTLQDFIPEAGEIFLYENEDTGAAAQLKIGDGSSKLNELQFVSGALPLSEIDTICI